MLCQTVPYFEHCLKQHGVVSSFHLVLHILIEQELRGDDTVELGL